MITKKQLKSMSLNEQWSFLLINKSWPNREMWLRNVEKKLKIRIWLKRNDKDE